MTVHLYIESIFNPNYEKCKVLFVEWIDRRNTLQREGKNEEAMEAQEKASIYHDLMHSSGYFGDYTSSCLLELFNLTWEGDISNKLIIEGWMPSSKAKQLLIWLAEREAIFEKQLTEREPFQGWSKAATERYFRDSYQELKDFLRQAIRLGEAIMYSTPNI